MTSAARFAARLAFVALFSSGCCLAQGLQIAADPASEQAFLSSLIEYSAGRSGASYELEVVPTELGLRKAATGEVDVAGTSRAARRDDRQERQVEVFPVAWDALVVIVHPENPILNIRLQQLADIYQGSLTRWDQLGGERVAIDLLAHENSLDGVAFNLGDLILRQPGATLAATRRFKTSEEIIAAVESEPRALGVVNYSAARKRRLKLLLVEGVAPAISNIQSGDYLLYFPMYLAIRSDAVNRRDIRQFIRMATGTATRRILRRNGVVPYNDGLGLASRQFERTRLLNGLKSSQ
ncbi:MAG: substrate-binding domain-containing protein [Pseudomonadota bacterium]